MPFLAAVAAFALGIGGPGAAVVAFALFASAMATLVFVLTFLGSGASVDTARRLRHFGSLAQPIGDSVMLAAATVLVLEGLHLHVLDQILLR